MPISLHGQWVAACRASDLELAEGRMTQQRAIIVTMAGTGIGHATAARLQRQAWRALPAATRSRPPRAFPDYLESKPR
jgi:hypothetical protein